MAKLYRKTPLSLFGMVGSRWIRNRPVRRKCSLSTRARDLSFKHTEYSASIFRMLAADTPLVHRSREQLRAGYRRCGLYVRHKLRRCVRCCGQYGAIWGRQYGERRDVPQFFDEWKLARGALNTEGPKNQNPRPFAQTARDRDGVPGLLSLTFWATTPAAQDLRGGSTQRAGRSVHRHVR